MNIWFKLAIPCGLLCGLLIGVWSISIGNDFLSNSIGAFIGIVVAYILIGLMGAKHG